MNDESKSVRGIFRKSFSMMSKQYGLCVQWDSELMFPSPPTKAMVFVQGFHYLAIETKGRFFYLRGRKEDMVWADTEAELRKESHIKAPVVSIEGFSN